MAVMAQRWSRRLDLMGNIAADDDPPRPVSAIAGAGDVLDERLQRPAGYLLDDLGRFGKA